MLTPRNVANVIEQLEKLSKKNARSDDQNFNAMDYSGGNFDDAYSMGVNDGEILLARELLAKLMDNKLWGVSN